MKILSGKEVADFILERIDSKRQLIRNARKPTIAIVQIGDNLNSNVYIKNKMRCAAMLNFQAHLYKFDVNVEYAEIAAKIQILNDDVLTDGIIVQLPVPKGFEKILDLINPSKDVDGLGSVQQANLFMNKAGLRPCTPKGVMMLLDYYKIPVAGREVCIIGRSRLVGQSLGLMLLQSDAIITIAHSKAQNLEKLIKQSEIIFSAVGNPHFIKKEMVDSHNIIIDIGLTKMNGEIYGDLSLEATQSVSYYTPNPGGIGLTTVAALFDNLLIAYHANCLNN